MVRDVGVSRWASLDPRATLGSCSSRAWQHRSLAACLQQFVFLQPGDRQAGHVTGHLFADFGQNRRILGFCAPKAREHQNQSVSQRHR